MRVIAIACVLLFSAPFAYAETLLERGTYLMKSVVACGNCHTPQTPKGPAAGMELAGQLVLKEKHFTAYAPNITSDKEHGIGSWTDEEIITAIREGKRPDGSLIGPPMPFETYKDISDRDAKAIVAYLRTVKPNPNKVPNSEYNIPLPPAWGPPIKSVREPDRNDQVKYGEYLVNALGHCTACHSPLMKGAPDLEHQLGAGGQKIPGPWGVAVTSNITPHADGISDYSDEDIANAITKGVRPDGSKLSPPMGFWYYKNISPDDIKAIIAYLRQLEPKPSPKGG
ncbi:MAG: c-type cytochrome [Hyphomicrobiales bacterium]